MKSLTKITLGLAVMLGLGIAGANAQSATAPATMVIQTALDIQLDGTKNAIAFGTVSANTPSNVFLDPKQQANVNTGATTNVAQFNVTGSAGAAITVDYDATVTMQATAGVAFTSNSGGPEELTLTPSVIGDELVGNQTTADVINDQGTVTLDGSAGTYFIWVGGTLNQMSGQATGTYAGTFNIAVAYN